MENSGGKKQTENPGDKFEQALLAVVLERMEAHGVKTFRELAERAFPGKTHPERRLHAMRRWGRLGKRQNIRLSDAYGLAQALNMDIIRLVSLAEFRMQQEDQELNARD